MIDFETAKQRHNDELKNRDIQKWQIGHRNEKFIFIYMTDEFVSRFWHELSYKEKSMIVYYALKYNDTVLFVEDKKCCKETGFSYVIDYKDLSSSYPTNFNRRLSMILENCYNYSPVFGSTLDFGNDEEQLKSNKFFWLLLPETSNMEFVWNVFRFLRNDGYIEKCSVRRRTDGATFMLSAKAWAMALQNIAGKKIFLAMKFDDELQPYRETVRNVVEDLKYELMVIDEKEHDNYIPTEIEYEIRNCACVIADLTGHNNGVYYEAGLGRGLNKNVIFTCEKSAQKDAHFDVKQINTIFWEENNLEKFAEKLDRRLRSVLNLSAF